MSTRINSLNRAFSTIPAGFGFILLLLHMTAYGDLLDDEVERLRSNASVDWCQVSAPIDHFLLVRAGNEVCALRFTEFHRGHDAKRGTIFHSGEESFSAEYDWYCQKDGSGDFKRHNVTHGHRRVERKAAFGIGRLAFRTGNSRVKCGSFELFWLYPTSVSFAESPTCKGANVDLAPTKWNSIEELTTSDPKLKWFRCDEQRKSFYISIDEL